MRYGEPGAVVRGPVDSQAAGKALKGIRERRVGLDQLAMGIHRGNILIDSQTHVKTSMSTPGGAASMR